MDVILSNRRRSLVIARSARATTRARGGFSRHVGCARSHRRRVTARAATVDAGDARDDAMDVIFRRRVDSTDDGERARADGEECRARMPSSSKHRQRPMMMKDDEKRSIASSRRHTATRGRRVRDDDECRRARTMRRRWVGR